MVGFSLLVTGCSDDSEETINTETGSTQQAVSFNPYTNEFGQFEVTTKKEQLDIEEQVEDISLTIQSIEQGKVKFQGNYAPTYNNLAEGKGYVSYIKARMKIDAPVEKLSENIIF